MRKLIISLAAMALFFAGCQKPELVEPEVENLSFEATVEEFDTQTKTSLTSWNYIVWSAGDRLAIFQGSVVADEFLLAEGCAGQNKGTFDLVEDNSAVNGSFSAGTEPPCNVAFYPYAEGLNLTGDMEGKNAAYVLSNVVLPATQVHVANSFSNGSFPMVAVSESMGTHKLKFKNVLGAVKLSLKGTQTVKSIKIEGANGERLSGAATVTAYSNNLTPVITMTGTDEASKSVTLDCGDGVQLNEAVATNFYISLPPVLFEKGFKVVVKDAADQEYTMVSKENSVVLRSSILAMPEVTLGAEEPENPDEEDLVIPVLSVSLNPTSLKLYEGYFAQLKATVRPADATNKTVVWSSDDPTIATVDQSGLVTAVSEGKTTIYAVAGGKTATCSVTVKVPDVATVDYIDEYGINHGKGTAVGMTIWAPVNCGYHATDYQWGKLYQWGRKYGQGYDGGLYDNDMNVVGSFTDATVPEFSEGGVTLQGGQSANNENVFFIGTDDWLYQGDDQLWNSGTEDSPVKTKYDPCPEGWRVPTYAELEELIPNHSEWTINENSQPGYWFSGSSSYSSEVAQVFFPAAGTRIYNGGNTFHRGCYGSYWSSRPGSNHADLLDLHSIRVSMDGSSPRANGLSVRCVQNASGEPVLNDEDENLYIQVLSVILNSTSLKLYEGDSAQLEVKVKPADATNKSVVWSSSDATVATVDQAGLVRAVSVGSAEIRAQIENFVVTCTVTVSSCVATVDYIDEYGINHGKGTAVGMTVWAPVNCGYHATDYQWGKLYQWGRKYGQGYDGSLYDIDGNGVGSFTDATVPELSEGGVSLQGGQSANNENVFFTCPDPPYDWLYQGDDQLWNSGTEDSPVKTKYDPCPEGWRVPTYAELEDLIQNHSERTNNVNGQPGYWFCGSSSYSSEVAQVFFPAAGFRNYNDGIAGIRGSYGRYWSSRPGSNGAYGLGFSSGYAYMNGGDRAGGGSVRCVQN